MLALSALTLLSSCSHPPTPPPPEKVSNEQSIGISLASSDGAWAAQLKADIEAAAAKHPEVRLQVMEARDAIAQQEQIEQFRMGHAQVMIIGPQNPQALADTVAQLVDSGTSVIMLNRARLATNTPA